MTEHNTEMTAVSWLLRLRGFPAMKQARKAGRMAVGTAEMAEADKKKLCEAIEDSMEYGMTIGFLRREFHLPYTDQGFSAERKKYIWAFLASLRSTGTIDMDMNR